MSRLHNYKPLILLFFFSFCFFAGGQIARIFPPASVRTDDKSPSGNAASSGTVPTASTSGNPLSTILPAAENWGLSFQEEGKVPVGNASFDELQQYHAYYAQKTDKKVIYLTFDCGYENGNTPAILNALKRHNVQATFFVVGNFLRDNPELVKQMLKEGHTIGNHTFHHPDMSQIATKETFSRELKSVEALYKDITGKQITQTLLEQARTRDNIEICEYMTMVDLISDDNICGGVVIMDEQNEVYPVHASNVVLACGGLGGLYKNSTNFPHIAGDGLGIAMKHQVVLEHLDYIQIHPTTLYSRKPGRRFLISESVRGEGALLYDRNGNLRFRSDVYE